MYVYVYFSSRPSILGIHIYTHVILIENGFNMSPKGRRIARPDSSRWNIAHKNILCNSRRKIWMEMMQYIRSFSSFAIANNVYVRVCTMYSCEWWMVRKYSNAFRSVKKNDVIFPLVITYLTQLRCCLFFSIGTCLLFWVFEVLRFSNSSRLYYYSVQPQRPSIHYRCGAVDFMRNKSKIRQIKNRSFLISIG